MDGLIISVKVFGGPARTIGTDNTTTTEDTLRETIRTGVESRTGLQTVVTEQFDRESVGDRTVSRDLIATMRSKMLSLFPRE